MTHKKRIPVFISLLLTGIIALSTITIKPIELPAQLQNAQIYAKQRAKFAKVMAQAIAKHFWQQPCPHTLIEERLAQVYGPGLFPTQENINGDVEALYAAILENLLIDISPEEFLLGASSSAYQIEGGLDATSAAARFYHNVAGLPIAGDAIDFYHRYETDIKQLAEELHINAYRISLAWNRIQPQQGMFDIQAIEFYRNVITTLLAQGIKPMVVFHHYDIPQWFEDLGGFELQENGKYFQQFCLTVYTELASELGDCLISTCNAPEGPAFKGYFTGDGTPGEKNNIQKTHTVIANMYYELVDTALAIQKEYTTLKRTNPELKQPSIGTQINVVLLDPHADSQTNWKNKLKTSLGCAMADYIQSGGTFSFLVNGEYCMYTPNADFMKVAKGINVYRYHPHAHKAFDWIGVNIYSNRFLNGFEQITGDKLIEADEERYTDNANYRNYPEGIYRAVQMISDNVAVPLGKLKNKNGKPLPIIVTENGIATKDDAKRTRYFQRAIWTITQLIKDGYAVVGYLPWTSHDNYEWPTKDNPQGFDSKCYGFFAVNMDKNSSKYLQRTLKDGSRYYANFAQTFFTVA
ncbi:MAG TPA: family 1 glycosylhydrolase [Candidatus Babeliales bacterium]|nr:family 1 glycosylhydrolase [Candidatus Babeliales bacterium]